MTKTIRFIGMVLMAVLVSVGFAACSDDDDDIGNVSNIYGTWEATHNEGWQKANGKLDDEWDLDASELKEEGEAERYTFTEDGKVTMYYWSGSRWYLDETCDYTISGNKLRIEDYDSEGDLVITIKTLSESALVLEGSYSGTEEGVKYEVYNKITFKKVD